MAIKTTQSFIDLLKKSELLAPKDFETVAAAASKYDTPRALARALANGKALTRWQAAQLLAGRSSFALGKYRLLELLGRGGMGSVFAAKHTTMHRRVALKIISKQMGRDPAQLDRFLEEARTIAALDHPNIVRAYDVDNEGSRYFLVMEFVQGSDLLQKVEADGPLEVTEAAGFIRQAAAGLAHAHDRNMIHCDIKPANLIVNEQGVVKILDMGMTRLVAADGSSSDTDEKIVGTIDYMAPEQALEADDLDHRADIYSLGCTLYFLLTSRPPFGEGTLAQRIMKHQTQPPTPISELRSGVPDGLVEICSKMMAKLPADRYQTATQVATALEPYSALQDSIIGGPAAVELMDDDQEEEPEDEIKIEPADDAPVISVTDTGTFSIKADSARGRPVNKPLKSPHAAKRAKATGKNWLADPRAKWALIITAGVVALATIVGGLMWLLGDGDGTSADGGSDQVANSAPAEPPDPATSDESLDLSTGLEDLGSAFAPTTPDPGETEAPPPAADPAEPAAAEDVPAETPPEEPPAEDPSPEMPPESPTPPADPPPAEPAEPDTAEKPEEEPKPAPPEPAPNVDALKDFPVQVALPVLNAADAPGAQSKAPLALGTIAGANNLNWQLLLIGGETALKGDRKFILGRTNADAATAAWSVQHEAGSEKTPVAKLWRDKNQLMFQWAEEALPSAANYLRYCLLQTRVSGKNKYTSLIEPVKAEPLQFDLLRGTSTSEAALKYAPDADALRVKIEGVTGRKDVKLEPSEPVDPKTQVQLFFVHTDRHGNDHPAAAFRIRTTARRTSTSVELRLEQPTQRYFQALAGGMNEKQISTLRDRLETERANAERAVGHAKGNEVQQKNAELDAITARIWYVDFLLAVHQKATVNYQIVTDVGDQELVLISTK